MASSNVSKSNIGTGTSSQNQVKQIIGVMSAKGGVGKSFVTGLLASGLSREGYQVGILDADLTGSSIPMLFGLHGPAKAGQYSFLPHQSHSDIKIISMNLLFDNEDQSVIWKESLTGEVIKQLSTEVEWGALDYLLIDMPPATSEVGVTIMQTLPIKGVIIVTNPQGVTTKIVNKAVYTAQKIGVPILGVVENMAYYLSPDTGEKQYIFGQYRGESVANTAEAPVLTQIPLHPLAAKLCDSGRIEEVIIDEGAELMDAFLESLSDLEKKKISFINENHTSANTDEQEYLEEDMNDDPFSSSQHNMLCTPFSDTVMYLIHSKENIGVLDHPTAQGYFLGRCGDRMQIDLYIIAGRILEAKFMADGCGATFACGSMITKMACTKNLDQAGQITSEDLLTALGGLPEDHEHCAELAVMTLREAVIDAIEGHGKSKR